jgi:hypothetical protein
LQLANKNEITKIEDAIALKFFMFLGENNFEQFE